MKRKIKNVPSAHSHDFQTNPPDTHSAPCRRAAYSNSTDCYPAAQWVPAAAPTRSGPGCCCSDSCTDSIGAANCVPSASTCCLCSVEAMEIPAGNGPRWSCAQAGSPRTADPSHQDVSLSCRRRFGQSLRHSSLRGGTVSCDWWCRACRHRQSGRRRGCFAGCGSDSAAQFSHCLSRGRRRSRAVREIRSCRRAHCCRSRHPGAEAWLWIRRYQP